MIPPDADVYEEALEEDEEGLAAERTDLAWGRSGLSVMACGVAILKGLPGISGRGPEPYAGALVLLLGGVVWFLALVAAHRRQTAPGEWRPVARLADVGLIAVGTAAVGVAAAMLVVLADA